MNMSTTKIVGETPEVCSEKRKPREDRHYQSSLARPVVYQLLSWVFTKKTVVQIGLGSPKTKFQS